MSGKRTIYKTPEGKRSIIEYYDRVLKKPSFAVESTYVNTGFGTTHTLIGGKKDAEPLVVFHGGSTVDPVELQRFERCAECFRVYAPDLIGEPGKSQKGQAP